METIAKWCDVFVFAILTIMYATLLFGTHMSHFELFIGFGVYVASCNSMLTKWGNE